jgi:hypothetical protein
MLPSGCVFHPRCRFAMARCAEDAPPLEDTGIGGRVVACWLQDGPEPAPEELALPEAGLGAWAPPATGASQATTQSGSAA